MTMGGLAAGIMTIKREASYIGSWAGSIESISKACIRDSVVVNDRARWGNTCNV